VLHAIDTVYPEQTYLIERETHNKEYLISASVWLYDASMALKGTYPRTLHFSLQRPEPWWPRVDQTVSQDVCPTTHRQFKGAMKHFTCKRPASRDPSDLWMHAVSKRQKKNKLHSSSHWVLRTFVTLELGTSKCCSKNV